MSGLIVIVLIFTVIWGSVSGSFSVINLVFGAALAVLILWLIADRPDADRRFRPLKIAALALLFVVELLKAGWRVARIVVRRDMHLDPAIIEYPLRLTRDFEIALLANLITLTPGTLSVDVSEDRKRLFIHCIDVPDHQAVIDDVRDGFEAKIMEAFP